MDKRPIGVFDSGVGGLTVVRELLKNLPNERIVYFGDTARVPYGTKSKKAIVTFSLENALFLLKKKVKLIVVACNTSSSLALSALKKHFHIPIIGVIDPAVEQALRLTRSGRIGVIGTRATIESKVYEKKIHRLNRKMKVYSKACSLFVPFVEEGCLNNSAISKIASMYLKDFKERKIDTLILGCTHYPLLKEVIANFFDKDVILIDSGLPIALEVKEMLIRLKLAAPLARKRPRPIFFVSDEPARFKILGRKFLKNQINKVAIANR
ncbi:MAG: glutamate racemase [Candidatus Omnitrophica bacterium]|nr:glutamate racemase [Candidatus Omnitrophota bacterium]